jgi:hypothetical protein
LVVDDEKIALKNLNTSCERGYDVVGTESGLNASSFFGAAI